MRNKKNIIRLTESQLKKVVSESVKLTLNEFIAGGNNWERTYGDYKRMNRTNVELDDIVRDLHTICQYYDEIYQTAYENMPNKYFPQMNQKYAQQITNLIAPIYSLLSNRSNRKGDNHAMTIQDIQNTCMNSLQQLANDKTLGVIYNAAIHALKLLQNA